MKKLIIFLSAIFELIIYLFVMVELSSIEISNNILSLCLYLIGEIAIAYIFFLIFKFIKKKFKLNKSDIYIILCINMFLCTIIPFLIAIIIPNETIMLLAISLIICALYYGLLINIIIALLVKFRIKDKEKIPNQNIKKH